MEIVVYSKEEFKNLFKNLKIDYLDYDFLYEIYLLASRAINEFVDKNIIKAKNVSPYEIANYCFGEYIYNLSSYKEEELSELYKDEKLKTAIATSAADKYISLSSFKFNEMKLANKFLPTISSLSIYLNFMLTILNQTRKRNPQISLIHDLFYKSVSIANCVLNLLTMGFETEAFSTWRTLHECECTLTVLDKYKEVAINRYLIHMEYGLAFKNLIPNKEKQDEIFYKMKEEMKPYGLKSKDIKKYIEYGWLYCIDEFKDNPTYKLNFRDGLEKIAGLSKYEKIYESSSEIIHSTPMLIYSNKIHYYYVTLLNLYESFFRLEKIFVSLFISTVTKEQANRYIMMRKMYMSQLLNIHKKELNNFINWRETNENK